MSEKPRKREIVIEALLSEATLEAAARRSKISSRTIRRWLRDEDFVAQYRQARRQLFDSAVGRLVALTEQAIRRLSEILHDEHATTSSVLAACRIVLERAFAAQQIDLEERLEQIERELEHLSEETP